MIKLKNLLLEINPILAPTVQDWLPTNVTASYGQSPDADPWFDEFYIKLKSSGIQMKLDKDKPTATKELEKRLSASGTIPKIDDTGNIIPKSQQTMRNVADPSNPWKGAWIREPDIDTTTTSKNVVSTLSGAGTSKYPETEFASMMYYGMWVIWRDASKPITFGKLNGSGEVVKFTRPAFDTSLDVTETTTDINYNLKKLIISTSALINQNKAPLWSIVAWLRSDSRKIWNKNWAPLFKQAREWWITRLTSKDFETKIRKIRGWSDQEYRKARSAYIQIIKQTSISAADGRFSPGKSQVYDSMGIAYTADQTNPDAAFVSNYSSPRQSEIFIQTSYVYENNSSNIEIGEFGFHPNDVVNTTIHELQHSLWSYLPFNPSVNWKKVFKSDIHMGSYQDKVLYTKDNWWSKKNVLLKKSGDIDFNKIDDIKQKLIDNYGIQYSLTSDHLNQWLDPVNSVDVFKKPADDDWYGANANEHASRLAQFKQAKGLKVSDNITVQHVIDTIKQGITRKRAKDGSLTPESYLVPVMRGWVRNGMPDIAKWVQSLNRELVVKREKDKRIQPQRNKTYRDYFNQST